MKTADLHHCLNQRCYQHIRPHIDQYLAEPDFGKSIPLMDPITFDGFALGAVNDVIGFVLAYVRMDSNSLRAALDSCLADFRAALERYDGQYDYLCRGVIRPRIAAVLHQSRRTGRARTELAANYFSGWSSAEAAVKSRKDSGDTAEQQVQVGADCLQQSFNAMLHAYDQAMTALVETAVSLLDF